VVLLAWQPLAENDWVRDFAAALAAGREQPPPPSDACSSSSVLARRPVD
jgi:hypothetical protein